MQFSPALEVLRADDGLWVSRAFHRRALVHHLEGEFRRDSVLIPKRRVMGA